MPPKDMIKITYMYLKGTGWKTRTKNIEVDDLDNYLNNKEFRILHYNKIKC